MDVPTLASRTGVEPERIEELVRLRILRPDHDGELAEHLVATARLAFAFEASGIALDDVGAAIERGELPDVGLDDSFCRARYHPAFALPLGGGEAFSWKSVCPFASRTLKPPSSSSIVHGGGKRLITSDSLRSSSTLILQPSNPLSRASFR